MDFKQRKRLFNNCDPRKSLEPDDKRNVDFDDAAEGERPRGDVWVERLIQKIALADDPLCLLLTGPRGSGKSTELKRLAQRLKDYFTGGEKLFPVLVDADDFIEPSVEIDVPEVLFGVVYHAERQVLALAGKDPDKAGHEGVFTRLWNWLRNTDVEWAKQTARILGHSVPMELKTRASFRQQVRQRAGAHLAAFREQVETAIRELVARVEKLDAGYESMVIIVDSLEKLRGTSGNWHTVMQSAEQLFHGGAVYLRLPVHVIYTVPPALVARNVAGIEYMPMVKIHKRTGERFEAGVKAMRELVRRRITDQELQELLGAEFEVRIEGAIVHTGGYPRDLLRVLRDTVTETAHPISDLAWERILSRLHDEYRQIVSRDDFAWLAQVAMDKDVTPANESQRQSADRMLSNNIVLRYLNSHYWYDLHPAVKDIAEVKEAIEAAVAAEQASSPTSSA